MKYREGRFRFGGSDGKGGRKKREVGLGKKVNSYGEGQRAYKELGIRSSSSKRGGKNAERGKKRKEFSPSRKMVVSRGGEVEEGDSNIFL